MSRKRPDKHPLTLVQRPEKTQKVKSIPISNVGNAVLRRDTKPQIVIDMNKFLKVLEMYLSSVRHLLGW
jgi:hypothetical protein